MVSVLNHNLNDLSIITTFFLFSTIVVYGQKRYEKPLINDSIVKMEMACFIYQKQSDKDCGNRRSGLKKITMLHASDSSVYFEKGNWISLHRLVDIELENYDATKHHVTYKVGQDSIIDTIDNKAVWGISKYLPTSRVKGIRFGHLHRKIKLPDIAFDGIFEPPVYHYKRKSFEDIQHPYHKAFISADGWRMYIYMLNGKGKDRYEVIWVIHGNEYYGRFINKVPE